MFIGAAQIGNDGSYTVVGASGSVPLFQSDAEESDMIFAANTSKYIRLDPQGQELFSIDLNSQVKQASLWGSSLYTYSAWWIIKYFSEYSIDNDEIIQKAYIPINFADVDLITADGLGNTYVHQISQPTKISVYDNYGSETQSADLGGDILFMDTFDDSLIAYANKCLYFFDVTEGVAVEAKSIPCSVYPSKFLSATVFVDNVGDIYSIGDGIKLLCKTGTVPDIASSPMKLASLHYVDEAGYIYSGGQGNTCNLYDSLGNLLITYNIEGNVRGANSNGIITDNGSELRFSPYSSFKITDAPPPDDNEYPEDWEVFENYLIVPQGTTIAKLKSQYDCTVTFNGVTVTSGICRSEMLLKVGAEELTIIIMGDLNSSGTVNTEDVKLLQKL